MLQVHVFHSKESSYGHRVASPLRRGGADLCFAVRLGLSFVEWPQTQHCMLFAEINQIWTINMQERWSPSLPLWVIYCSPGGLIPSFIPQCPGKRNAIGLETWWWKWEGRTEKPILENSGSSLGMCLLAPQSQKASVFHVCSIYIHLPMSAPSKDFP